jgi:hypothetical protein
MRNNGYQLVIATGDAWVDFIDGYFLWGSETTGSAYLYNVNTSAFGAIADGDLFLGGVGKFQWSSINDGSAYDATDFATAESTPTALIRGYVDRADVFLFKSDVIEVWFNSGADPPFERRNQTVIPKGIMGMHMVTSLDNSVFFVGRDGLAGGSAIVYRLSGFEAQRVSTHAVELALSSITDWSSCRCIGYLVNGHAFMAVILDTGSSWVYDCATQEWHEEETYQLGRWIANSHSYAYDKHIIGSSEDGNLYQLDPTYYWHGASTLIEREMISVPFGEDATWKTMGSFQVDLDAGTALGSGQGSNPQIILSMSDDRGRSYGNTRMRSMGTIGVYNQKVIWRQLGRFRSRVFKLQITDPVRVAIVDYFADVV